MKLAAVDIGSNAVRLHLSNVLHRKGTASFKRMECMRYPLCLGNDVFKNKRISRENEERLTKLLHAFTILIDLYEIDHSMFCATAAFRNATNRDEVAKRIQEQLGVAIQVISGEKEALLLHKAVYPLLDNNCNYVHLDVGGGSIEINLYTKNKEKCASRSFDLGYVRATKQQDLSAAWKEVEAWIAQEGGQLTSPPQGIATGGYIGKLVQLAKGKNAGKISLEKLIAARENLASYSPEERMNKLTLNPDRADMIIPAAQLYERVMIWAGVENIMTPNISLRDGIVTTLYEQHAGH